MKTFDFVTPEEIDKINGSLNIIRDKLDKLLTSYSNELPARYVKTPDVCRYFGFSRSVLERLVGEGKIKAYHIDGKPGGDRFFKMEDIYDLEDTILS